MRGSQSDKSTRQRSFFISIYLLLAFGAYFISLFITRIARIKDLLGL